MQLNEDLNNTVGYSERISSLSDNLQQLQENNNIECGAHHHVIKPNLQTSHFYQLLSYNEDPEAHLVKEGFLKKKDNRRQMASTSVRNLASHIAVVAYANFRPVKEA